MGRGCLVWLVLGLSVDAFAQEEAADEDAALTDAPGDDVEAAPAEAGPMEAAADPTTTGDDAPPVSPELGASGEEEEAVDAGWTTPIVAPEPTPEAAPVVAAARTAPSMEAKATKLSVQSGKLPLFPDELEVLHRANTVRCEAFAWVDANGHANRVVLTECPDGLHLAALTAMEKWRWQKPSGSVPAEGVKVAAVTAFEHRNKKFYPGVTYFRTPTEVSGADLAVSLASGKMPKFPRAVSAGDDVCLIEVVVDANGKTSSALVEECTQPYAKEMAKAVKSWKWSWAREPAKGETATVVTEVVFRI